MKKITFIALFFCTSLVFAETDPQVKPVDDSSVKPGDVTENKESTEASEALTFTDEPLEEEVVEDEAFLELLKTALIPELHPLDEANGAAPAHISLSFVSDEEISKPQVEAFRKMYLSPKWSALLRGYLESAMEYRLYVRKAVQDAQMPEMLEYLPVVESNYKTNAKSRSGAIGMWQFMANSVWPFLTLNDFVDERLDPWKSTDAALRKLTDNYIF